MKKVILSLAIVALATLSASAQKKNQEMKDLRFSVGVDAGIPTSNGSKGVYYGADAQGEYAVTPEIGVTLSAGYLGFSPKGGGGSTTTIPVLVGGRYYFSDRKAYASAQVGVTIYSGGGSSTSALTYAPGVGYYVTDNIDIMVKYQAATKNSYTNSQIALRAAYNF